MKKAGFDREDRVVTDVGGRNLSRFVFCLASPVLMQPLVLSHLKILKNEHTERNVSFL